MFILPCFIYRRFQLVKITQYWRKRLNSESKSTGKEETMTSFKVIYFLSMAQQPIMDQCLLIIEASRSHSETQHSAGFLWTSDRPVVDTPIWRHTTLKRDRHLCSAIPAGERPQTHSLDRAATGIGNVIKLVWNNTHQWQEFHTK